MISNDDDEALIAQNRPICLTILHLSKQKLKQNDVNKMDQMEARAMEACAMEACAVDPQQSDKN